LEQRQLLSYTVTDLGTFGGSESSAFGINEEGVVVGKAHLPNGVDHAFVWTPGNGLQDLGTLGGQQSNGFAVNESGVIVGIGQNLDPTKTHATRWTAGTPLDLGTLGGSKSRAFAIADDGRIVGDANMPGLPIVNHAFVWQDTNGNGQSDAGEMVDLGTFPGGGFSTAQGINSAGQIAGHSALSGIQPHHAFRYENGVMHDLGTLGGNDSKGWAINEKGQVAGSSTLANGARHAFLYLRTTMKDIGTLGGLDSEAFAINDLTRAVGYSLTSTGAKHAFLWSKGYMYDLNDLVPDSDWTFVEARGINNKGQIVGVGINPNLESHAFLLTPDPERSFSFHFGTHRVTETTVGRPSVGRMQLSLPGPTREDPVAVTPTSVATDAVPMPAFRLQVSHTADAARGLLRLDLGSL
jgi:probable HAF family extracellular repeat protein